MVKWSQLCEDTGCGGVPKSCCTGSQQSSFQRDFLRTILMVQFAVLCWLCVCFLGPSPLQDQCRSSHFPSLPWKSLHLTGLPAFLFSDSAHFQASARTDSLEALSRSVQTAFCYLCFRVKSSLPRPSMDEDWGGVDFVILTFLLHLLLNIFP